MNKETTFWNLLKDYKIAIPKIQRDYAQGRHGKEYLRNSFLTKIKDALDGKEKLKIDFVYGSTEVNKEEKILKPLDGQQRLTTLWLLHWFIAYKAGKLKYKEFRDTLLKFSYETRNSSRDFCDELVNNGQKINTNIDTLKSINNNLIKISFKVFKEYQENNSQKQEKDIWKEKIIS